MAGAGSAAFPYAPVGLLGMLVGWIGSLAGGDLEFIARWCSRIFRARLPGHRLLAGHPPPGRPPTALRRLRPGCRGGAGPDHPALVPPVADPVFCAFRRYPVNCRTRAVCVVPAGAALRGGGPAVHRPVVLAAGGAPVRRRHRPGLHGLPGVHRPEDRHHLRRRQAPAASGPRGTPAPTRPTPPRNEATGS